MHRQRSDIAAMFSFPFSVRRVLDRLGDFLKEGGRKIDA
jgi:hypothetical protein